MSTTANKEAARRFIDDVFVKGRADTVPALVTQDFVSHGLPGSGPDVMTAAIARIAPALSGAVMETLDVIADEDRVAVRLLSTATQTGTFMGMPATGKTYAIEEIHIFRIVDGRVAEHWHQGDMLGMMGQLGLMPAPAKPA